MRQRCQARTTVTRRLIHHLDNARRRLRDFGPAYVVLAPIRRAAQIIDARIEQRQLTIEGRRGVLGEAHRAWRDHAPQVNKERWGGWDWSRHGEEWTISADWKQALIADVLLPTIPEGGTVLEIGPGAGRWTEVLSLRADKLIAVDLDERILEHCRDHLGAPDNVEFMLTTGSALPDVRDHSVDAIWSFDVFVHIAPIDQDTYLAEFARVLKPGGVAAIHHADGRDRGALTSRRGWRAPMCTSLFAAIAERHGLTAEKVITTWGPNAEHDLGAYRDAISVLRQPAR
jgi:SAM-dependent methyltransferase